MRAGLPTDRWKNTVDDYVDAACELFTSMQRMGFDPAHAVPIDPDGELLGGAHRVACALALDIKEVPVSHMPNRAWAPAWDYEWFVQHRMPSLELRRTLDDFARLAL